MFPERLHNKLIERQETNTLRYLGEDHNLIDFSSNDYLGFAKSKHIFEWTNLLLSDYKIQQNGSTGSRLLSGNSKLYNDTEQYLAKLHQAESGLLFTSGYTANLGLFSTILLRDSIVLYDEYIHASIRDGIQLSNAKAYKFKHNNTTDLERLLSKFQSEDADIYVVTESIFSMDGDSPNLEKMTTLVEEYKGYLIIDEAHALGVFNLGLVQKLNLHQRVFARIMTFGKGLGCHGAIILGSQKLKDYLINFCRPFIYTTGLAPHQIATIRVAYEHLISTFGMDRQQALEDKITYFKSKIEDLKLNFIESNSAIHCCIIKGNERVKKIANQLNANGYFVKPILSPTVAKDTERLRFCIHNYNSIQDIENVLITLKQIL